MGGRRTRGSCWDPLEGRGKGGSNTGLWFCRVSVQCLGHFVPDSQLLTRVPIKSKVKTSKFTRSQLVTPLFVECPGKQGGLGRDQTPLEPVLGRHFGPGSPIYGGQLLDSGMQTQALEIANFYSDEAQVPWASPVTLKLMPLQPSQPM